MGTVCFCVIVLVDKPVKSRKSFGSSNVYEKSFDMSSPRSSAPCSGFASASDPMAWSQRDYSERLTLTIRSAWKVRVNGSQFFGV